MLEQSKHHRKAEILPKLANILPKKAFFLDLVLGTDGDRWGPLGTAGDAGDRRGRRGWRGPLGTGRVSKSSVGLTPPRGLVLVMTYILGNGEVYPTLNAMVVVPMNPHTLSSRPIVLDSASVIDITVSETNKLNPVVTCDGQNDIVTMPGDVITISRYKDEITLIHPQNSNFYDACRSKLGWGSKLSS